MERDDSMNVGVNMNMFTSSFSPFTDYVASDVANVPASSIILNGALPITMSTNTNANANTLLRGASISSSNDGAAAAAGMGVNSLFALVNSNMNSFTFIDNSSNFPITEDFSALNVILSPIASSSLPDVSLSTSSSDISSPISPYSSSSSSTPLESDIPNIFPASTSASSSASSASSASSFVSSSLSSSSPRASPTGGSVISSSESDSHVSARSSKHSRARLEAQMRCDQKRRKLQRSLYSSIRDTLKSAELIHKKATKWIEKEDGEDTESKADSSSDDRSERMLKERMKRKAVDDYSSREVIRAASNTIRALNDIKLKLERQLSSLSPLPNTASNSSASASSESVHDENPLDISNLSDRSAGQLLTNKESSVDSMELSRLLEAICLVNRQYTSEMNAVRSWEQHFLPRLISDLSTYFKEYSIVGVDGTFLSMIGLPTPQYLSDHAKAALHRFYEVRGSKIGWREANMNHLHALVALSARGRFHYRNCEKKINATTPQNAKAPHNVTNTLSTLDTTTLSAQQVLQMLKDTACAPAFFASPAKPSGIMTINDFLAPTSTSSSSSSSSSSSRFSSSSSVSSYSSCSSPSSAFDLDSTLNHPLGPYSLPGESSHALLDVLRSWVEMGAESYEEQMDFLRPLAKKIAPQNFVTNVKPVFFGLEDRGDTTRDMAFHPVLTADYEKVKSLYELWSGQKPMVRLTGRALLPGTSRLSMVEMNAFLIRHPENGTPLAIVILPGKMVVESGEDFQLLEKKAKEREAKSQRKFQEHELGQRMRALVQNIRC